MSQLKNRVTRLEQARGISTPTNHYFMIVHMWAPSGGSRVYITFAEKDLRPGQTCYAGPFKTRRDAMNGCLEDLKKHFPEAYARLMDQQDRIVDLQQVVARLTEEEYQKAIGVAAP